MVAMDLRVDPADLAAQHALEDRLRDLPLAAEMVEEGAVVEADPRPDGPQRDPFEAVLGEQPGRGLAAAAPLVVVVTGARAGRGGPCRSQAGPALPAGRAPPARSLRPLDRQAGGRPGPT